MITKSCSMNVSKLMPGELRKCDATVSFRVVRTVDCASLRTPVKASVDKAYALEWYANTRQTAFVTCSLFSVALRGERTITLVPRSHARIHARSK